MKGILWVDLEMTGLAPKTDRIIEVAAIVTGLDLEEIGRYHAVVKQPQEILDNMDEWNKKTHSKTGLLEKISSGKDASRVEEELISFSKQHLAGEKIILAGSSIHHDRNFIRYHFKNFEDILHYRMLDVTSLKLVFKNILGVDFEKKNLHKSMDDIKESISELKFYIDKIKNKINIIENK